MFSISHDNFNKEFLKTVRNITRDYLEGKTHIEEGLSSEEFKKLILDVSSTITMQFKEELLNIPIKNYTNEIYVLDYMRRMFENLIEEETNKDDKTMFMQNVNEIIAIAENEYRKKTEEAIGVSLFPHRRH